jgi:undecaprenyl-diphosphatase
VRESRWQGRVVAPRLIVSLLALAVFAVVAGDVVNPERGDLVPMLDHALRAMMSASGSVAGVQAAAAGLSWVTGKGLALVVLAATAVLWRARRPAEVVVLIAGTTSAWAASGLLKTLLAIPRPHPVAAQYGFPSAHTFVTLVALGLIAWSAGRRASATERRRLTTAAVVVAVLTGVSRLVLDMHWLSDVVAGLACGTVWLNASIALAEGRLGRAVGVLPRTQPAGYRASSCDSISVARGPRDEAPQPREGLPGDRRQEVPPP